MSTTFVPTPDSGIDEQSIEQNLARLPDKVARALAGLLSSDHIDERLVRTLCKAGELSGSAHVLLGFAVSLTRLEATGVPVVDTLDMAYTHGRRVSLTWSKQRWQDEHNRLSRMGTLKQLAAENRIYPVEPFAKHLPEQWPGYLISSSRRLGMEGLRQRHCVASYTRRLMACEMAIAVVFIDRVRWTVGLVSTGSDEHPLQITEIRSRFNSLPTPAVRDAIYDALRIKQIARRPATATAEKPRVFAQNLQRLLPILVDCGIANVFVSFDGSGDSGAIDSVECINGDKKHVGTPDVHVDQWAIESHFKYGAWSLERVEQPVTVHDAIENIASDYLEETGVDWYNNDGGYGEFCIDVTARTASLEVNTRFVESECAFDQRIDIDQGTPTYDVA